jgi:multimeric flavodoxin WrbA
MGMYDLLEPQERQRLGLFAENLFEAIETKTTPAKAYLPLPPRDFRYMPGVATEKIDNCGRKVLLLSDSLTGQHNLSAMVERFSSAFVQEPEVVDLGGIGMKSGCQGCIQCGYDNECCQDDGFTGFFRRKAAGADIIVFAGSVRDRFLSSAWKMYLDRSFFMNHTPALQGKQFGVLFSGPLSRLENLREILSAFAEWQGMNPVDFVSDELEDHARIDQALQALARRLVRFSRKEYIRPSTFLGVGGMKIFRDAIWGPHRFVFQADHRYFKRHGLYDFPQNDIRTVLVNAAMMLLTKIPAFRRLLFKKMIKPKMVEPHQKVLKKLFKGPGK